MYLQINAYLRSVRIHVNLDEFGFWPIITKCRSGNNTAKLILPYLLQLLQNYILMHDLRCSLSFQVDIPLLALLHLDGANLQMQTHFVLKIKHQNIAVIFLAILLQQN